VTTGSTSATTYYLAGLEEIAGGVVTKYLGGTARRVGTALSYLATDGLGSISASLDTSRNLTAAQLFATYGTTRYSSAHILDGQRASSGSRGMLWPAPPSTLHLKLGARLLLTATAAAARIASNNQG
jgi:hypothetical protein